MPKTPKPHKQELGFPVRNTQEWLVTTGAILFAVNFLWPVAIAFIFGGPALIGLVTESPFIIAAFTTHNLGISELAAIPGLPFWIYFSWKYERKCLRIIGALTRTVPVDGYKGSPRRPQPPTVRSSGRTLRR